MPSHPSRAEQRARSMEPVQDDLSLFKGISRTRDRLREAIARIIVGQDQVVEHMLIALLSGGHCLFVGVPGLAKTLLVRTAASALGLEFSRIQFTPDLMPADIIGTEVLEEDKVTGRRSSRFIQGPVFSNLLLADEINRTPPKTQAALLEAMQELAVTAAGHTRPLDPPFLVLATQNPIEQEGTYPLPEAQLDRFMLSIQVGYPSLEEEIEIVRRGNTELLPQMQPVVDRHTLLRQQALIRRLPTSTKVIAYAVRLVRATRPDKHGSRAAKRWVRWGASPRASQYLAMGARARAALNGYEVPHTDDVLAVAPAVLTHRLVLNFEAEASGISPAGVVREILGEVQVQ